MAKQTITEFYRNLPPKVCADCGNQIEEQCESYLTQCDHCKQTRE
ncbi:protein YhfH [Tuberibacillus sp. Marseille-P3662]|nr:protein YhfH [Tuberibacillus sp. Marseille-P3662]